LFDSLLVFENTPEERRPVEPSAASKFRDVDLQGRHQLSPDLMSLPSKNSGAPVLFAAATMRSG